ncbi:pyrophosphate-energized vacuolar membrane proton pump-like protein, partial [Tanacetum coccineum]
VIDEIQTALKKQLIISTILMTVGVAIVSFIGLPTSFTIFNFGVQKVVYNWHLLLCVCVGLWAGLIIGFVTEYYTSNAYGHDDIVPFFFNAAPCKMSPIPAELELQQTFAAMYRIAVAALGMLSTIATGLAIDAYGPISDNAGGIAEMAGMSHRIRERTDALDAAGNTTAAIGKGFAIGSAALVSLALFGAFVSRAGIQTVDVLTPKVFIGLIVGSMLPYWFSAMTIKSVGSDALKMVEEVRRQFNTIPGLMEGLAKPDYTTCVKISTDASIKEMIPPGALVMLTPLIVGTFFGVETLSGVLAGALVSGVQVAISASNTGGAWDNAKKYIEAGASEHARTLGPKGSEPHKAAVIGDTIGDPLKDTSGPSLNILIKLMAVESLVFAPFFAAHGGLLFKL